jgi:hypothetical protein
MNYFGAKKLLPFLLAAFAAVTCAAQGNPPWNISMAPSTQDSGFVTVDNKCTAEEQFNIYSEKPTVSWIQFIGAPNPKAPVEAPAKPPTVFTLASGEQTNYTIGFNTNGLQPGDYETTVTVDCPECVPPACKYVGKKVSFPINLTVAAPAKPPSDGRPGGSSNPSGGSNSPNGGGPATTGQNNPPATTGNPTNPTTTDSTTGTKQGTPPPPTTVSPGTPTGNDPGTNPTNGGATDPVPPTQSTNSGDWVALLGGVLIAAGIGLATGSGRGGVRTQTRNSDPPPPTTARTTDNPIPPTQSTPVQDGTPGTATKQKKGDWDVTVEPTAPPNTTGGQSVTPNTTDKVPTGTPATITKSNGGDWTVAGHGPLSDRAGTPVAPSTSEKPQDGTPNTTERSNAGDGEANGHGPLFGETGGPGSPQTGENRNTGDLVATDQGPAPQTGEKRQNGGDQGNTGTPQTQEAPNQKQCGDWDARIKMKEAQHQPGDRNEGGGRTFTREGTLGGLGAANRPPTQEELAGVRKGIGTGSDDYATRERKTRQRMADLQLSKQTADPIVAGGKTFVKVPWDGAYDPTGESEWIKGVREDLTRDDVQSDTTRRKIREWQLEIYQDAYTRARQEGLDNLVAHAAGQIALDNWLSQSREQFEQMMGTYVAMLGGQVVSNPIGNVNQAIAELGELGEQAAADMARTRELARTLERQRGDGPPTEIMGNGQGNSGNMGQSVPQNGAGDAEAGTQRFTSLERDRATRLSQARAIARQQGLGTDVELMGEEDIASQQANEAYVRMKALGNGDLSSLARASEYTDYGRQVLADPQCRAYLQAEGLLTEMENMVNFR